MARNLSLAIGRPTPSLGVSEMIGGVLKTIAMIFAAGRVGAAVDAHHAPLKADLKAAGLEDLAVLRPPYRF
ncbi:MAG: hypothetical protein DI565_04445 [Ancylobacter novellus]|uniref:Uncharacterized protein n=1 Tax=Ancylobacter novellus TaxID=921 RepID=A0A2W5KT06_ANCNO|nr:MAG: hypothetical protein DI565_04445 [Ancylobacter novellus]